MSDLHMHVLNRIHLVSSCTNCAIYSKYNCGHAHILRDNGSWTLCHDIYLLNCYACAFQAECYHYLFDAAIKLYQLGIDWTTPEHGPINSAKRPRSVLSSSIPNGCPDSKSSKVCSLF